MAVWERGWHGCQQSRPWLVSAAEINNEEPMGREPGRAGRAGPTLIPAFSSGVQWGLKCASPGQHQRKGEIRGNGRGISEAQDTWRARNQSPISLWLPTYGSLNLPEKKKKRKKGNFFLYASPMPASKFLSLHLSFGNALLTLSQLQQWLIC